MQKNEIPLCKNPKTNTKSTTKNKTEKTTQDYLSIYRDELEKVRLQIDYDTLVLAHPYKTGLIDEIVNIISEINLSSKEFQTVNKEQVATSVVQNRFEAIDFSVMEYVLDSMEASTTQVNNKRAFLITTLYNAPFTIETHYDTQVRHDLSKGR